MTQFFLSINNLPTILYVSWVVILSFCLHAKISFMLSQISYSLVVILELSGISEVQYKEIMLIGDE